VQVSSLYGHVRMNHSVHLASPEENVRWKPKMPTERASGKPVMVPAISAAAPVSQLTAAS
jgi:hypothetical protein